jgi:hypothetical protein
MKRILILLGLVGACAACCAVPVLLPLLLAGIAGTAWLSPQLALALAAALILAALCFTILRHWKARLGATRSCGCRGVKKEQP